MASLKDRTGVITLNQKIAKDIYKMILQFEDMPEAIKGGQFAHVKLNDKSHVLRRPFCICDYDMNAKTITMCYAVVGLNTIPISALPIRTKLCLKKRLKRYPKS